NLAGSPLVFSQGCPAADGPGWCMEVQQVSEVVRWYQRFKHLTAIKWYRPGFPNNVVMCSSGLCIGTLQDPTAVGTVTAEWCQDG
ncbi:hypothetical protein GOODEAATRI_015729, partial [Goodea atripinnis]